jgi:hypothetical protein
LLSPEEAREYVSRLTALARQLNTFADGLKTLRSGDQKQPKTLRELATDYWINLPDDFPDVLFDDQDFAWLEA